MTPIEQIREALESCTVAEDRGIKFLTHDRAKVSAALSLLSSMEGQTKTDPVDPLKDPLWSEIRSDIEKAAVDWATYPDSSVMDSDLHGQFIRVMAYVIESTNILHKSPRASPSVPCISVEDAMKQFGEWCKNDMKNSPVEDGFESEWKFPDLRERLTKAAK